MSIKVTQRNATRNQSTADYEQKKIFLFDNRFIEGDYKNTGAEADLEAGMLVARATGTYEKATVVFSPTALTAGQTFILAGLTYTSTAGTTQSELAAAFANLAAGATTGAGTATGSYSGALTGYTTGPVVGGNSVKFTSTATGNVTDLAKTGTGAAPTSITIVQGSAATAETFIPVTSSNLADVVGVSMLEGVVNLSTNETVHIHVCTKGTVDGNNLILPAAVTLNTIVGNKTLGDVLEALGLHVDNSGKEHTNFDN